MVEIAFANRDDQAQFQSASPLLFSNKGRFVGHGVAILRMERYARQADGLKEHVSILGAFLVERQCVFVHGGMLTTAGLLGSRSAELIAALWAFNNTKEQIARTCRNA